jgi:N-sulfoglucosamine sulfohydrolase
MRNLHTRRQFLKVVGTGATILSAAKFTWAGGHPESVRNVVLYVADDHGMNDAGCYGNTVIKTPGLDALANEGTRFTHAFCTTASCSASRSVILTGLHNHATGQYGHEHGYNHFVSFPHIKSLPIMLEAAGYRTVCAGKFHVAPEEVYHFQNYIKGDLPNKMADACQAFITADDKQSFFLYFCTTEPHRPFEREGSDTFDPKDVIVPSYLPDIPECREELAKYYGSVQRADKGLVRLIEILKKTGRWDSTLVIYISDNGIAFPGAKTTVYDPGIRLPCVVRSPFAKKKGIVTNAMISWVDITPTILDFAGAAPEEQKFHGQSFLSVLEQQNPQGWNEIYASHTFHEITMYYPMRAIRNRRYKFIWNIAHKLDYPFASDLYGSATWQAVLKRGDKMYGKRNIDAYIHRPEFELYDLPTDPNEIKNVADDPLYSRVLEELKNKLRAFQERTNDPWILKWRYE